MNILAIESASDIFSVSLSVNDKIDTIESTVFRSASEKCAEFVSVLLKRNKIVAEQIDFITVNKGPGSFTGLRVGLSFAQGFAFPSNIPIIGLNAFEILFHKTRDKKALGIIESKRDEVYLTEQNLMIEKVKKTDLASKVGQRNTITNNTFDLAAFISKDQIELQLFTAIDQINLFRFKQREQTIKEEDNIQLLYLNTFKPK